MKTRTIISATIITLLAGTGLASAQGMGRDAPATPAPGQSTTEHGSQQPPATKAAPDHPMQRGDKVQRNESQQPGNNHAQADRKEHMDRKEHTERSGSASDSKTMNRDGNRAARSNAEASPSEPKTTGQAGSHAKLTQEQRTTIRNSVQNVQPAPNVNFSIAVGAHVPRRGVEFHPLPSEIVTIYPRWRRYEFFRVGDEIVVVNPRTMAIVAVLDA